MDLLPNVFINEIWSGFTKVLDGPLKQEDILTLMNTNEVVLINDIYQSEIIKKGLTHRDVKKRRNQTKKRWTKSSIEKFNSGNNNNKELMKEFNFFSSYYNQMGVDNFKNTFNIDEPNALMTEKIKELKFWSNDPDSLLINYSYINDKTKNQIKNAIISDITTILSHIFESKYNGNIKNIFVERPQMYVSYPIFNEGSKKMNLAYKTIKGEDSSDYYYEDYEPNNELKLRTLIAKEYVDNHSALSLDELDNRIFDQIMTYRGSSFASQRKVFFNVGDIVRSLYKSNGINNYKRVEDRLKKMLNLRFNVHDNDKFIGFSILDFVSIDYANNWSAEVTIGEVIHSEFLNNYTVKLYKDALEELNLPLSRRLTFILQKERLEQYPITDDKDEFNCSYDYKFFAHKLRLPLKPNRETLTALDESMNEIINLNIGIQSYRRVNKIFYIIFKKLESHEHNDLINAKNKTHNLIE